MGRGSARGVEYGRTGAGNVSFFRNRKSGSKIGDYAVAGESTVDGQFTYTMIRLLSEIIRGIGFLAGISLDIDESTYRTPLDRLFRLFLPRDFPHLLTSLGIIVSRNVLDHF